MIPGEVVLKLRKILLLCFKSPVSISNKSSYALNELLRTQNQFNDDVCFPLVQRAESAHWKRMSNRLTALLTVHLLKSQELVRD